MVNNKIKIKLGDKVKDKVSGYTGIAVARTQFLNGCIQYSVVRKLKAGQDLSPTGDPSIDEMCLEVVEERVIESKEYQEEDEEIMSANSEPEISTFHKTGGPTRFVKRMRGY
jgi:hypothetical protein